MNINNIILKEILKRKKISVSDIISITGFSRAYINRFLQSLREDGIIRLIGKWLKIKIFCNDYLNDYLAGKNFTENADLQVLSSKINTGSILYRKTGSVSKVTLDYLKSIN